MSLVRTNGQQTIRRHDRPQKGNPHQLTIDQHIFPNRSICRYAGSEGSVEVMRRGIEGRIHLRPNNSYFCARRVWDQKSELGYMLRIENEFQVIADSIMEGKVLTLDRAMNDAVCEFYMLWQLRFKRFLSPDSDAQTRPEKSERVLDKNSEEMLEVAGVMFIRDNGILPGRFLAGVGIFTDLDRYRSKFRGTSWGIVRSDGAEFIVPDNSLEYSVVPLSPRLCLIAGAKDQFVGLEVVASLNATLVQGSHRYYFARNLAQCPILRPIPNALRLTSNS